MVGWTVDFTRVLISCVSHVIVENFCVAKFSHRDEATMGGKDVEACRIVVVW